ncbi:MAG TPA: hypothetical protein PK095_00520 [Myxococcota bacterium]|nr:hypothetical protein [Myxococcota bacterium]
MLGAVEAAGDNAAMKRAMVDHATQAMRGRAAQELDHLVDAYPGLRDVPEVERLRVARAKFQALQAEREGERKAAEGGFVGASTIVYVADAEGNPTPQQARYRLVEASQVVASHDPIAGFQQRKDYPDGVQERSYHRDKAEQEKVRRNAQGLKVAYVVNTNPDAVNGPPVMTSEGIVLGGNSRTMSMQLAYEQHPEAAERLKAHLRDNAHAFGFAKGDVDALERPILVREVELEDKGKANLGVLVRRYNESFTQGMDPRVDQVARGRMVTQGMLDSISAGMGRTNDSGDPLYPTLNAFLGSSDGMRFVSELSSASEGKAIIDRRNRSMYVGKDGKLNEDGKTFVERVLVGHVLPDPDLLGDMLPKHVSAIAAVVPHVVGAASKGHDVKEPLKTALDAYAYMRRKGLANVDEFERDSGGFASLGIEGFEQKPKLDALSKPLLNVIASRIDKPTQLASFFREFATQARRNPAGQASLLGDTIDTASLLQGSDGRTVAGQRDMFKGGTVWVELDERFGERIWSSVLAKGGTAIGQGEASVLRVPWWLAIRLGGDLADLAKAKYVKRVPTGKYRTTKSGKQGAPIYRYFYGAHEGGGVHAHDDMREGASFKHGDGHYHVRGVKDGKLHVVHSKTGQEEHLTHAQLSARLRDHHREDLERHRGRLHDEVATATSAGLADDDPRVQKIVEEHKKAGYRADPFSEMQRLSDPQRYEEITEREKRMRAPVAPPQEQVPAKTVEASVDANSDNLSSVSWTPDPEKKGQGTFRVKFKNGSTYRAEGVPFADFEAVRDGHVEQSPGKSFNRFIRGKHKLERELEGTRGKTPMGTTTIAAAHKDAEKEARVEDANKRVAEGSAGSGSKPQERTAAEAENDDPHVAKLNEKIARLEREVASLGGESERERSMASAFPLGPGQGGRARPGQAKRLEASIDRAKRYVEARRELEATKTLLALYAAGRVNKKGRSISPKASKPQMERHSLASDQKARGVSKDRAALEAAAWKRTHKDFKGWLDGPTIMRGGGLQSVSDLTDDELRDIAGISKAPEAASPSPVSPEADISTPTIEPGAKQNEAPKAEPSAPLARHIAEAKERYGLKGKEHDRLEAHEHTRKAKELFEAGDHEKAKRYLREAVKEVLYKTPERNMSPSSAERHMRARDSLRIMKALLLGARSTNSRAA